MRRVSPAGQSFDLSYRRAWKGKLVNEELQIRPMTRDELDLAVEWAAQEGWNPGLADAECFHAADPEGFLIGVLGP
jgi:hypothetical protein